MKKFGRKVWSLDLGLHLHCSELSFCRVWLIYLQFNAFKPPRRCEKLLLRGEMGIFQRNGYHGKMTWEVVDCKVKRVLCREDGRLFAEKWVYCIEMEFWVGGEIWPKGVFYKEMSMLQRNGRERFLTEMRGFSLGIWDYMK